MDNLFKHPSARCNKVNIIGRQTNYLNEITDSSVNSNLFFEFEFKAQAILLNLTWSRTSHDTRKIRPCCGEWPTSRHSRTPHSKKAEFNQV